MRYRLEAVEALSVEEEEDEEEEEHQAQRQLTVCSSE
jgi:hypothetical protein